MSCFSCAVIHFQMGIPASDVVVATAVSSGVASMMCGICGNLPFGLAPGTGLSAYLSYGLVLSGLLTRTEAMTACLISGASAMDCRLSCPIVTIPAHHLHPFISICEHRCSPQDAPCNVRFCGLAGAAMGLSALMGLSTVIMKVGCCVICPCSRMTS
jgi:hypothetical protein